MGTCARAAGICVLFSALSARALEFGEPAAPLDVKAWLAGEPFALGDAKGRLVVVLFWATWDGSPPKIIGCLNRIHQVQAADVAVVAITTDDEAAVRKFVAERGVAYRIGLDNGAATKMAWMKSIPGLPHAFVVGRDGRVAWHGEPQVGLQAALSDLLAGKLDRARYEKLNGLRRQLVWATKAGKVPEVMSLLEQMIATVPEDAWAHDTRAAILAKQGRAAATRDAYLAMGKGCKDDPDALGDAARHLATASQLPARDAPAAVGFAQRAAEITANKDPEILETLARAHYELGHLAKAAEAQALAVEAAAERERPALEELLLFYRREAARRAADPEAK